MATISYDEAAHLLRRMGFGGTPEEIEGLAGRGRERSVDFLVDYEKTDNSELDNFIILLSRFFEPINHPNVSLEQRTRMRWFLRMLWSLRPFQEKMTLFWHNHFATGLSKVPAVLMYQQNDMMRANALERFDDLLLKVARDPAMLLWLDGVTNVNGRANDNFARELQELFSMGTTDVVTGEPNYSEQDVREVARAFTGWKFKSPNKPGVNKKYKFLVRAAEHDNGLKTIYGQTANFAGEDVISIIAARRSTARFLVYKLFAFFVYLLTDSPEDRATIEKFADVYVSRNHSTRELVRAIFKSDEFFSARARNALIKNPAEVIVTPMRMLGLNISLRPPERGTFDFFADNDLMRRAGAMGLDLFSPLDVSGWNLDLGWINTATMIERYNAANDIFGSRRSILVTKPYALDYLRARAKDTPEATVDNFLRVLGPLSVEERTKLKLVDYLLKDDEGNRGAFNIADPAYVDRKVRGLVYLILCLPEFHLN